MTRQPALFAVLTAIAAAAPGPRAAARAMTDVCGQVSGQVTWTRAASPYASTCDLVVPAGSSLTIEPGVELRMGTRHKLSVSGSLRAVGTAEARISVKAAAAEWDSVQLLAGGGPSELGYVTFSGGGAGRKEMLGIATDQAVVHHADFLAGAGVGLEVKAGASPQIRDSRFEAVTASAALPPAALRIQKGARPLVQNNHFLSNLFAISMDAGASPSLVGNRFDYNGHDGVVIGGVVNTETTLPSLGPRRWSYRVDNTAITVDQGGKLTIQAGATLRFTSGGAIRVRNGTLAIRGAAGSRVQLRPEKDDGRAGAWPEVLLETGTVDYDPATGQGSVIEQAEILYGGAIAGGALVIRNSSPRVASNLIRQSGNHGITITGPESRPQVVGNVIVDQKNEQTGNGIVVSDQPAPDLSFNILRGNLSGMRVENAAPRVGPHNWFDFNRVFGLFNEDRSSCIEAGQNDWGDPGGPTDTSDRPDPCGQGANGGRGEAVSDGVRYLPFEGQLVRPQILAPRCGLFSDPQVEIRGLAAPGSKVVVYDNYEPIGEARAAAGSEVLTVFTYRPAAPFGAGSHVIQVTTEGEAGQASGITQPVEFSIDPGLVVDPAGLELHYDLEGIHYVQPFQDEGGCLALRGDGEWNMRVHPPPPGQRLDVTLKMPLSCPAGAAPSGALRYQGQLYPLRQVGARHEASFPLDVAQTGAPVSLLTQCGADARETLLGSLTVEYDGFAYNLAGKPDPFLNRVSGATVTLFAFDVGAATGEQWKAWPGDSHHGQTNPQITGPGGWFGFYPQPGQYRVRVEAPGFETVFTDPVTINSQPVMPTIGLKPVKFGAVDLKVFLPLVLRGQDRPWP